MGNLMRKLSPAESGDGRPFGTLDPAWTAWTDREDRGQHQGGRQDRDDRRGLARGGLYAGQVAYAAVGVVRGDRGLLERRPGVGFRHGLRLVLMAVVPEVRCARCLLMPAESGRCTPGKLERQHDQQKEKEKAAHDLHCSEHGVSPARSRLVQ